MLIIPVTAVPNQRMDIVLDGQNCTLRLWQRGDYLYLDLDVNGLPVRAGMICLSNLSLTQYRTAAFSGALLWIDLRGLNGVPNWREIGTRYNLLYLSYAELVAVRDNAVKTDKSYIYVPPENVPTEPDPPLPVPEIMDSAWTYITLLNPRRYPADKYGWTCRTYDPKTGEVIDVTSGIVHIEEGEILADVIAAADGFYQVAPDGKLITVNVWNSDEIILRDFVIGSGESAALPIPPAPIGTGVLDDTSELVGRLEFVSAPDAVSNNDGKARVTGPWGGYYAINDDQNMIDVDDAYFWTQLVDDGPPTTVGVVRNYYRYSLSELTKGYAGRTGFFVIHTDPWIGFGAGTDTPNARLLDGVYPANTFYYVLAQCENGVAMLYKKDVSYLSKRGRYYIYIPCAFPFGETTAMGKIQKIVLLRETQGAAESVPSESAYEPVWEDEIGTEAYHNLVTTRALPYDTSAYGPLAYGIYFLAWLSEEGHDEWNRPFFTEGGLAKSGAVVYAEAGQYIDIGNPNAKPVYEIYCLEGLSSITATFSVAGMPRVRLLNADQVARLRDYTAWVGKWGKDTHFPFSLQEEETGYYFSRNDYELITGYYVAYRAPGAENVTTLPVVTAIYVTIELTNGIQIAGLLEDEPPILELRVSQDRYWNGTIYLFANTNVYTIDWDVTITGNKFKATPKGWGILESGQKVSLTDCVLVKISRAYEKKLNEPPTFSAEATYAQVNATKVQAAMWFTTKKYDTTA